MALELVYVQYWIEEYQSREIHDTPCIGASEHVKTGSKRHGPYESQELADSHLISIRANYLKDGWKCAYGGQDPMHLMRGDEDIGFSIKRETKDLGPIAVLRS